MASEPTTVPSNPPPVPPGGLPPDIEALSPAECLIRAGQLYRSFVVGIETAPNTLQQVADLCRGAMREGVDADAAAMMSRALLRRWMVAETDDRGLVYEALLWAREAERRDPGERNTTWRGYVLHLSVHGRSGLRRAPPAGAV